MQQIIFIIEKIQKYRKCVPSSAVFLPTFCQRNFISSFRRGLVGDAAWEEADLTMEVILFTYKRVQMAAPTVPFGEDFLALVAPNPAQIPKYLGLVLPLQPLVWACLVLSVLLVPFCYILVSRLEAGVLGRRLKNWESYYEAGWYAYGTFLGESITRDIRTSGANATRLSQMTQSWALSEFLNFFNYKK